ncbi:hypothetical protein GC093_29395 [Paenibacillus sp. LMG 31456]|uniref:Aldolase n=1 Tax=Paenibacillus foliorum TaxID=2654974 RepID=A0A972K4U3_9BACL|nr:hypothetical protein [Paenibacillus foliorum]NOU97313.1 hypothetical protein [Paenibacillus foliorum]
MHTLQLRIGEHLIQASGDLQNLMKMFKKNLLPTSVINEQPDLFIHIKDGYGVPFVDYSVDMVKEVNRISFRRADYLIEADSDYKNAYIYAYDDLALKHALINLYSSFIVSNNWGLLIHSSCVMDGGKAHIFAGESGAGKSTAAELSYPRELLSDEATLVKITADEITVYNSPFRSEMEMDEVSQLGSLASINILYQAPYNERVALRKSNGFILLMDKVFYWAHDAKETGKIIGLMKLLANRVPIYELHFQKNDTFWELIS